MSSINIAGDTSGSISIAAPSVAGSNTLTLPASTGTVLTSVSPASDLPSSINGPAFSAYVPSNTTISNNTWTKITFSTEEFDTNNNFDSTTNYRFTPTVAGYYQINLVVTGIGGTGRALYASIYKNGSSFKVGSIYGPSAGSIDDISIIASSVIYCNGSTDYLEFYALVDTTGTPAYYGGAANTYVSGFLARAA